MIERSSSWRRTAVTIASIIALAEFASLAAIVLLNPHLDRKIRRVAEIFQEQSDRIRVFAEPNQSRLRIVFDPILGFRNRSGYRSEGVEITGQGVRSHRIYRESPPDGVVRAAAFGDSMVYAGEVKNQDSWPYLIEQSNERVEVLNYGVGAYGTAQAYLRFQTEGMRFAPHLVIIGFSPPMLARTVNVYRRFLLFGYPLVKPRYELSPGGTLSLVPSPLTTLEQYQSFLVDPKSVIRLGSRDHWYEQLIYQNPLYDWSTTVRLGTALWLRTKHQYWDPNRMVRNGYFNSDSEAFRIQTSLLARFASEVRARGAIPLIVIFPDRSAMTRVRRGRPPLYQPLLRFLAENRLDYADLNEAFRSQSGHGVDAWFSPGAHYSTAGNRIVASSLTPLILDRVGVPPGRGADARSLAANRPHPNDEID